jgi:HEAT repeat protein
VDPDAETPETDTEPPTPEEPDEQLDFRSLLLDPRWKNAPAAVEYLATQGGTFATKYLSISLTQGYFALRAAVIQALSSHPSTDGMELLITALGNSEPGIQEMAATSLSQIRDPRVAVALLQIAEPKGILDKRTRLRAAAMVSLGALGCTAATNLLLQALRHRAFFRREAAEELSIAAATALGRLGTARARAALEQGTDDRRAVVQEACYKALNEATATSD